MSLRLSTAPHIRSPRSATRLMLNVIIALVPSAAAGVYLYGVDALSVICVAVISAVAAEYAWQKLAKQPVRVGDLSAVVTGLILALIIPPAAHWWMVAIGSCFAILIVKQLFGGIGDNFLNPAMAARAMLLASWPARMTAHLATRLMNADAVTSATPLITNDVEYIDLLLGNVSGAIGETCKIAILAGLVFMILTKTISWRIPVITLASAFVCAWVLGMNPVYQILSGGLMFAAVFMATDYSTSPMTSLGQCAYAVGIGIIAIIIRKYGQYPEGATYAVLFMNLLTPLFDKYMPNRIYGYANTKEANKA